MVNFRKKEIDGQNLLEALSPKAHVSKYFDMENVENLSDVSIESLDLTGLEEGFVDLDGGWFSVTSFGKHSDNVHCVREAFDTLQSLLSGKSRTLRHIAKVVMYIDNMENYAEMNSQYVTYFGLNPPVRVCVAPEVLCEGCRLVLVCVGQEELQDRRVLHVQSVSHWAPANIGPYSQGVRTGSSLLTAGSIGLLPGSMTLLRTEAGQAGLALRHVKRVASVMAGRGLEAATSVTCYVTSKEAGRQAQKVWMEEEERNQEVEVKMVKVSALPRYAAVEWELEFTVDHL